MRSDRPDSGTSPPGRLSQPPTGAPCLADCRECLPVVPSPVDELRQASKFGVMRVAFRGQRCNRELETAQEGEEMTFVGIDSRSPCRAPVRSTADRLVAAWHHSQPIARRSMVAASVTSVAVALSMHLTAVLAASTAAVGVLLAAAALVDSHERRLPNRLLIASLVVALAGAALSIELAVVRSSLLGMAVAGGLMLVVRLSRGVGMGDVKMASVVGASVGAGTGAALGAFISIAIAALAAATYGLIARRQRIALGPSLWLGWVSALALVSIGWLS